MNEQQNISMCVRACVCACMCVGVHVCFGMCVCVCMRERACVCVEGVGCGDGCGGVSGNTIYIDFLMLIPLRCRIKVNGSAICPEKEEVNRSTRLTISNHRQHFSHEPN